MNVTEYRRNGDNVVVGSQLALPVDATTEGEVRLYRLRFPYLPPSKNVMDGWQPAWKSSAKRKWEKRVALLADELAMPRGVRHIGLAATLIFPTNARRDPQNYSQALWNWIPDGLQKCGVLVDDRDGAIDFGPNLGVRFAIDDRKGVPKEKRQRTVVAVTMLVTP